MAKTEEETDLAPIGDRAPFVPQFYLSAFESNWPRMAAKTVPVRRKVSGSRMMSTATMMSPPTMGQPSPRAESRPDRASIGVSSINDECACLARSRVWRLRTWCGGCECGVVTYAVGTSVHGPS